MMDPFQSNSMEDLFDSSLRLEDTHMKQGFQEVRLCLKLGFETGGLLGFYKGCACVWNSLLQLDPTSFSAPLHMHLKDFEYLIENYPLLDPEDDNIDKMKDVLRVKFNMICASLGISKKNIEYRGYPKPSSYLEF